MKTEGLSFTETVERLAQEAGVPMPQGRARAMSRPRTERSRLYELLAASAAFFEKQLAGPPGQVARQYLAERGLMRPASPVPPWPRPERPVGAERASGARPDSPQRR